MITRALLGSIVVTTAVFVAAFAMAGWLIPVALALALGVGWLVVEWRRLPISPSVFFTLFAALAIIGGLGDFPAPLVILGLCASLAAWDLSRFRTRVSKVGSGTMPAALATRHVSRLGLTAVIGFVAALAPLAIRLPANFYVLALALLVALLALRAAVLLLPDRDHAQ